jgi:hypothetical protein
MYRFSAALFLIVAGMAGWTKPPDTDNASMPTGPAMHGQTDTAAPSKDCEAASPPKGATRVYIALRGGKDGSGRSPTDARDGSTVEAFDAILRCYSEGCANPANPGKSVARTENLIVCLGAGTFSTLGSYDYIVGVPHKSAAGFTVGSGWKIHGAGQDKTTVRLSAYLAVSEGRNPRAVPLDDGTGLVFGTNSDDASNVEISDLTIDANYPELKARARQNGIRALTLEAIWLRSGRGGHWIHNVNVLNTAGETGGIDIRWEAFHILIISMHNSSPSQSTGNLVENVTMRQSFGGSGCGIIIANATGEVRHSLVEGYPIGYGGWKMGEIYFHDNIATGTEYGFNIDSWDNNGVRIESNQILHPRKYGIVVGGEQNFSNFSIINNKVQISQSGVVGLMFRGNVTHSLIAGNKFIAEGSAGARSTAIRNYSVSRRAGANQDNSYQQNQISAGMKVVFDAPSQKSQNCFFHNQDERGGPFKDLPDNRKGPCVAVTTPKAGADAGGFSRNPPGYLQ